MNKEENNNFIYIYTNKINGHQYIGQTNNLQNRFRGHKSDSFNPNSHSYNYPLHSAIRKYGLENFSFEILESNLTQEQANKREIYWIAEKKSHVSYGGYNITFGGEGHSKEKRTWEELKDIGKVFNGEEIEDIQKRLLNEEKYDDIIAYYSPRLTRTFLSNLNNGRNFKNPNLKYPLKRNFSGEGRFSKEEIQVIKQDIKSGISYSKIAQKYKTSVGFISMINTGKYYHDDNEKYPLIIKGCTDKTWIRDCLYDIIFSPDAIVNIAKKYGKAESTIKKLGQGLCNKQEYLKYPLRAYRKENQEIFKQYFI